MLKLSKVSISLALLVLGIGCSEKKPKDKPEITIKNTSGNTLSARITAHTQDTSTSIFSFEIRGGYKATELGKAIYDGNLEYVKLLLSQGKLPGQCLTDDIYEFDLLYTALIFNKLDIVRFALENKIFESLDKAYSEESECPLTLACSLDDSAAAVEISKRITDSGANVNGPGPRGGEYTKSPLIEAVTKNNYDLVKFLLEKGASKNVLDISGQSPKQIAETNGFNGIVTLLTNSN